MPTEVTTCLVEDADDGDGPACVITAPGKVPTVPSTLAMIAVRPDLQGEGRGAALMRRAERHLRDRGQRMLGCAPSGPAR